MQACPPSAAGDATREWRHPCSTKRTTKAVDAWLQEMGRVAFATAAPSSPWSFRHSSSWPAEAAATESYPPLPGPGLQGLKTLCILAKGSIPFLQKQEQQRQLSLSSSPSSSPPSSPSSSSTTTDSVATRMYLKTLAVHGQFSLRPGNLRSKQETVVKKIIDALSKHQEAALHVPDWTARLLLVAGRLLCSLGRRSNAVALLQIQLPLLEASSMAAPLAIAYLWLQYTQWAYYDQGAWMDKPREEQREAAAKVEVACRQALMLLHEAGVMVRFPSFTSFPSSLCSSSLPSSSQRVSLYTKALVATASFRLADLLLERGAAADALELCRISLRNAAPVHFPTLAVYLAAALQALGQGGKTEAAIEVRMEKKLRRIEAEEEERCNPSSFSAPLLPLPRSASLLNMHGLEDMWNLPAEPWLLIHHHNHHRRLPQLDRRFQKQQQQRQEHQQLQEQSRLNIPGTERRRQTQVKTVTLAMDVCGEKELEREGRKQTHVANPPPIGTARPRPASASSSSGSDGWNKNVFAADIPPQKRHRSQRYPILDQIASCVVLPSWAVSAHG